MFFKLSFFLLFLSAPALLVATDNIEQRNARIVNSVIALLSDDFMSAGSYEINDGGANLDIYHLPGRHQFKPFYKDFNIYVNGSLGYAKLTEDEPIFLGEVPDKYEARTKIVKGGFGLRYKPNEDFQLSLGYALIYAHYKPTYSYNSALSRYFVRPIVDDSLNANQKSWTNEFVISTKYEHEVKGFVPFVQFEYKWYHTRSELESSDAPKTTSDDSLLRTRIGTFTPTLFQVDNHNVKINAFAGRTYFYGDLVDIAKSDYYDTYGGGIYIDFKDGFFEQLGIISEWTDGENFDGFNVGLDISFNF